MEHGLNTHQLIGYVGKDGPKTIEMTKKTETADARISVNFTMATTETWRDRQTGEMQTHTEWHRIRVTDQNAATWASKNINKGSHVLICGRVRTRSYVDAAGVRHYVTETCVEDSSGRVLGLDRKTQASAGEKPSDTAVTTASTTTNQGKPPEEAAAPPAGARQSWDSNDDPRSMSAEHDLSDLDDAVPF